jgi:hypothetical protein
MAIFLRLLGFVFLVVGVIAALTRELQPGIILAVEAVVTFALFLAGAAALEALEDIRASLAAMKPQAATKPEEPVQPRTE